MRLEPQILVQSDAARLPLAGESVHCAVTSPPYYSLRKYQGEQERDWPATEYAPMPGLPPIAISAMRCALGLEPTPESYVARLVLCFRELWRVLRDDGACWIVEGDSYSASSTHKGSGKAGPLDSIATTKNWRGTDNGVSDNLKPGDLMMIPHRLALALQADGWMVRQDCIWAKAAPMPESVAGWRWEQHRVKVRASRYQKQPRQKCLSDGRRDIPNVRESTQGQYEWRDCPGCPQCEPNGGLVLRRGSWRHTRAHETVLMLSKRMNYFANSEVVREGIGLSRTIENSNLQNEFMELLYYLRSKNVSMIGAWPPSGISNAHLGEITLFFARMILKLLESENDFSVWALDQKIGIELAEYLRDLFSTNRPKIHFLVVLCSSMVVGNVSTEEFIQELYRFRIGHGNTQISQKGGAAPLLFEPTHINCNSDTSLTVNYSSRISEFFTFIHNKKYNTSTYTLSNGRNPRSVLTPNGENYAGPHYAVFPSSLVAPLIRATCPVRACPECGAGWVPIVERKITGARHLCPNDEDTGWRKAMRFLLTLHHGCIANISITKSKLSASVLPVPAVTMTPGFPALFWILLPGAVRF